MTVVETDDVIPTAYIEQIHSCWYCGNTQLDIVDLRESTHNFQCTFCLKRNNCTNQGGTLPH
jgi:hypothetical protein